jgi:uncharacterized protein DUF4255
MSSYLAIATVTAALQQMLQTAVGNAVPNANVGFSRPDAGGGSGAPLVNLFLYQVTPNAAYRNADLSTRRPDGTLVKRPQAALDLHYLFTFHGNEDKLEPQRLLGAVTSVLNQQPLLSLHDINKAEQFFTFLGDSGLENQIERVRITPTSLTLEEFSKLWSAFFQVEYNLSAAYQASVVLIEGTDSPQEALPVQSRNLYTAPFRWPRVDRIVSQAGADVPILSVDTILIQGRQLRGEITVVLTEDQELTPSNVRENEITLTLPASVHAGVKSLQVVQKTLLGTPPVAHRGVESNAAAFVLRPSIGNISTAPGQPGGTDVTLDLSPQVAAGQRAVLILNQTGAIPSASFVSPPVIPDLDTGQVTFNVTGMPAGAYLTRVQVDGAESVLTPGPNNQFSGPLVNL